MTDADCVALLRWALPRLRLRWAGYRRVRRQVCKRIARRLEELGLDGPLAYRERLESDPAEWTRLDACCRITISRFCRDRAVFEQLGSDLLPELARAAVARGSLRLRAWSAGCASGEEPYSLNLLWRLQAGRVCAPVGLQVTATDADEALLERARTAIFPSSALRELPAEWRGAAFERCGEQYRLLPEFRMGVEFLRQDIRQEQPPPPFDLILCRNGVFTYFEPTLQRQLSERIAEQLGAGGILVLGTHESLPDIPPCLGMVAGGSGILRKAG